MPGQSASSEPSSQDRSDTELLRNIAAHLPRMARLQPDALAVAVPEPGPGGTRYRRYSFAELNRASDVLAHGLEQVGIGRGTRTALMVPPSFDFFALTFALFKTGAVPVLIDPGIGIRNLSVCLGEASPEAFIGIPKAQVARIVLRWARKSIRTVVTVGRRWGWSGVTLERVRKLGVGRGEYETVDPEPDDMAAVLFTSGSTGVPKGAVYSHGNFVAQVEHIRRLYGIEPGEIDLPTFPLFALFDPALGTSAVIPDMDPTRPAHVESRKLFAAIEEFGVTTMFGSPALLNRVGRDAVEQGQRLPTLRRVLSAGAPVSPQILDIFTELLQPGAQVFTPYGATESLPVASIGSETILSETRFETDKGAGVCVGHPVPGVDVRVIRISDDPIESWSDELLVPTGEVGELVVRGANVTASYFERPESTRLAKIHGVQSGSGSDFWHRMGDLGYFDKHGRIWFCGRKSHRVQTQSRLLFTDCCEGVFNAHPGVFRTALVGVRSAGATIPVVCVEVEPGCDLSEEALFRELGELGAAYEHTRQISEFLLHPAFPVDIRHNAKIFREKLQVHAQQIWDRRTSS